MSTISSLLLGIRISLEVLQMVRSRLTLPRHGVLHRLVGAQPRNTIGHLSKDRGGQTRVETSRA